MILSLPMLKRGIQHNATLYNNKNETFSIMTSSIMTFSLISFSITIENETLIKMIAL
jgi:hypothetical protein